MQEENSVLKNKDNQLARMEERIALLSKLAKEEQERLEKRIAQLIEERDQINERRVEAVMLHESLREKMQFMPGDSVKDLCRALEITFASTRGGVVAEPNNLYCDGEPMLVGYGYNKYSALCDLLGKLFSLDAERDDKYSSRVVELLVSLRAHKKGTK